MEEIAIQSEKMSNKHKQPEKLHMVLQQRKCSMCCIMAGMMFEVFTSNFLVPSVFWEIGCCVLCR